MATKAQLEQRIKYLEAELAKTRYRGKYTKKYDFCDKCVWQTKDYDKGYTKMDLCWGCNGRSFAPKDKW